MSLLPETDLLLPTLAARLGAVAKRFEQELVSDLPAVNMLSRHVENYRGKMLRPTLVIASGLAVRANPLFNLVSPANHAIDDSLDTLGAVVEMIHMATLVHDDVLDEADLRRGGETVNSLRGNETAVMLGDFLISSSFHLCSSVGESWLNSALGEMTSRLCSGEILQLSHRGDLTLDSKTYFEIIRRKTGVLAGACCGLAARLAGATPAVCEALRLYGEELGMAFQIQDDVLDLVGEQRIVGKTLGIDLRKGKFTLPLVTHLTRCNGDIRQSTIQAIEQCDVPTLLRLIESTGSLAAAREQASEFVNKAKARLSILAESPARQLLWSIADATIEREF